MAYYPSKSGSILGHDVQDIGGQLSCSCDSRVKCWAVLKEEAKLHIDRILGIKTPEVKIPDLDSKRQEAQQYAKDQLSLRIEPTLEQIELYQAGSREMIQATVKYRVAKKWTDFYRSRKD